MPARLERPLARTEVGGVAGAGVATLAIFLPAFLLVAVSGPFVPRVRRSPSAGAFLDGVNVASLALMAVVTWQLGRAALVDPITVALAALMLKERVRIYRWSAVGVGFIGVLVMLAPHFDAARLAGGATSMQTLGAVLAGLRAPASGLLLLHGLDPASLGEARWRKRVAAAPQFQENHVFGATFAFGSGLAALGGALGAQILGLDPIFPLKYMIYFLIVVSVGGTTSITGPFLASILLGIGDVAGKYFFPTLSAFVIYTIMIVVLIWRPQGLFSRGGAR